MQTMSALSRTGLPLRNRVQKRLEFAGPDGAADAGDLVDREFVRVAQRVRAALVLPVLERAATCQRAVETAFRHERIEHDQRGQALSVGRCGGASHRPVLTGCFSTVNRMPGTAGTSMPSL